MLEKDMLGRWWWHFKTYELGTVNGASHNSNKYFETYKEALENLREYISHLLEGL